MKPLLCAAAALLAASVSHAQTYGCDSPESKQLDFWLGDWELSYVEDGKRGTSRNRITKTLDGCAVLEEFTGGAGTRLDGRSFSTYDRLTKRWKQTWVDNTASYLDFTGGLQDGEMVFAREMQRDGKTVSQRMVFRDVKRDSLTWLWQRSDDGGKTWTTQWEIDYRRLR
jgi:hypothetical protein